MFKCIKTIFFSVPFVLSAGDSHSDNALSRIAVENPFYSDIEKYARLVNAWDACYTEGISQKNYTAQDTILNRIEGKINIILQSYVNSPIKKPEKLLLATMSMYGSFYHIAAGHGDAKSIEILLSRRKKFQEKFETRDVFRTKDVDFEELIFFNQSDELPLHTALNHKNKETALALISDTQDTFFAHPNFLFCSRDKNGKTPIALAKELGYAKFVGLCLIQDAKNCVTGKHPSYASLDDISFIMDKLENGDEHSDLSPSDRCDIAFFLGARSYRLGDPDVLLRDKLQNIVLRHTRNRF